MASTSGITISGITSGLDTDGIISKLVSAEGAASSRLQAQQTQLQNQQSVYSSLRTALSTLSTAAGTLNMASTYQTVSGTSSDTSVATVSASSGATVGTYSLTVSSLAQTQKISSSAQSDTTTALGQTGSFIINGKQVDITASDTLTSIATKINSAGSGVTASLINGGTGSAYLTIAAGSSGISNKIQLADVTGSVLSNLGVVSGASSFRSAVTNGGVSNSFSSNTSTLTSLVGSSLTAGTITIDGSSAISIDPTTDSLQTVADKINAAGVSGVSATVKSTTKGGTTTYQLQLTDTNGTPTITDSSNLLSAIGLLQKNPTKELVSAQDASYTLDGIALTNSSNTITDAIPGASLTLLAANSTTPKTSTINLTQDLSSTKANINNFVSAYNNLISFISSNSSFDTKTFNTGLLFGDSIANQVTSGLSSTLFTSIPGLDSSFDNLTDIGFSFDSNGSLAVDDAKLTSALTNSSSSVAKLFMATGQGSNDALNFVSSTSKTKASSTGYDVNITQLATKQSFVAGTAQTTANSSSENLLFNGAMFGNTQYTLSLDAGSTLATTVAKINGDSKLKDLVYATIEGGKLRIDSKRFGTNGNFTVTSDHSSSTSNSGVGVGGEGTTVAGVNIAGTIGGEPATGNGQFLTADTANAYTSGLQIQYTGNSLGSVGSMAVRLGIGNIVSTYVGTLTDSTNGLLSAADKSLQSQIDDLDSQLTKLSDHLTDYKTQLQEKFAAMEEAMNTAKTQASQLSSFFSSSSG